MYTREQYRHERPYMITKRAQDDLQHRFVDWFLCAGTNEASWNATEQNRERNMANETSATEMGSSSRFRGNIENFDWLI